MRELALSLESARRAGQVAEEFRVYALDHGLRVGPEITEALRSEARVLQRITDLGHRPALARVLTEDRNRES
jgi:ubiquinone/menaquinone biosynthesis C-methylase UbiE